MRDLILSPALTLPARLLSVTFSRSGGPGGQNVNKVATKADVRLDLAGAAGFLPAEDLERLRAALGARIDAEGRVQVVSSRYREQARNVEDALARMEDLLRQGLQRPRKRKRTRPSAGSRERRLGAKKHRSRIKQMRGRGAAED
ncbi:MAG: alternative ribosome rescue aminoacyl-tRNA hydrolase ArfB [Planctomycetota bacterium]|nr:alternative ribosome rescue aminoacyl-tRNA hydrolase ArfB [Planctomycetota bacterium]